MRIERITAYLKERPYMGLCLLAAFLQGAILIGTQYGITGALSLPLDDSFIHLQYGKQIAQGHYFHYQNHDPVTSGATSFLYVHLLALGYLIGFRGVLYLVWTHLIALASVTASIVLLVSIGKRLGSARSGWMAAILMPLSGNLAWCFWSGMEIALVTALLLYVFYLALDPMPLNARLLTAMGFLSLCRPEGAIVSIVILSLIFIHLRSFDSFKSGGIRFWGACLFFIVSILGPPLFFLLETGRSASNGLLAKGILYHPTKTLYEKIEIIISNFASILAFLSGYFDIHPVAGEFVLPGMLVFAVTGLAALLFAKGKDPKWHAVYLGAPLLAVFLSIATLEVWPLHNFRYLAPFMPIVFVLGVLGLNATLKWIYLNDSAVFNAAVMMALLMTGLYFPGWAARFAANSTTIYEKQIRAARWIGTLLPSGQPVAINDAGALIYYNDRTLYPGIMLFDDTRDFIDLVGLVDNDTTIPYRMGEGGLYEILQRMPEDQRPACAAVFPAWFDLSARLYDFFYKPLVFFPDPYDETFGKTVYAVNWNYNGKEANPRKATMKTGWIVRDAVDVCDIVSEKEHDYEFSVRGKTFPKIPILYRRNFGYHEEIDERWPGVENEMEDLIPIMKRDGTIYDYDIMDGGRRIDGEESFSMRNLTPGCDAFLIARICDGSGIAPQFEYRMEVFVNDIYTGSWTTQGTPWNWYETVFKIPADAVTDTSLRICIVNQGTSQFVYYESYYYWICQEENTDDSPDRG